MIDIDNAVRCQWCDSVTGHRDYCPQCGRCVRGGSRGLKRHEKDLVDLMSQDEPRRIADGFAWIDAWVNEDDTDD